MQISEKGLKLIEQFEGLRLTAYKTTIRDKYYTIGYGHYGADVKQGMTITEAQAEAYLRQDVKEAEDAVNKYSGYGWNQNQFDALVSFAYNVGNIDGLTNNGKRSVAEISAKLPEYVYSDGVKLEGLVRRRAAERALFDTPVTAAVDTGEKSIDILAREVIAGKYGDGDARKSALGDQYSSVQNRVNEYYAAATACIRGDYGNGTVRKEKVTAAGYDYATVQGIVNQLL
jgi:GH24 family phage-related lysozyme (muramidase)